MSFTCGHPMTPDNTYLIGGKTPNCRTCKSARWHAANAAKLREQAIQDAEVYRLYEDEHLCWQDIAATLGILRHDVWNSLRRHRQRNNLPQGNMGPRPAKFNADGTRCRCGLRLPCNNCTASTNYIYRYVEPNA